MIAIPPSLYLASGSPRRRDILIALGYAVHVLPSAIDETPCPNETAHHYVDRMAKEKNQAARQIWAQHHGNKPAFPILSADTTVAIQQRILGKPSSPQHAETMLHQLSGQTHQVLSAVCVSWQGHVQATVQCSDVRFAALSAAEISAYVATGEPLDKAGAYGIQGLGGAFVAHLSGSFTGVMGLPVYETLHLLRSVNWPTPPWVQS